MRRKLLLTAAVAVASILAAGSTAVATGSAADGHRPGGTTDVQILALNDFHGNLEPVPATSSAGRIGATPAGGAAYLATHVDALRATNPNTLFVSAGDLIGATPLLSALFHDEPTIEAFNEMGLDYHGVGNHEFDEGVYEVLRMQHGGCHPVDGCQDGDPFEGADFTFLAANVAWRSTGETIFPPYRIHQFPGVDVAVIGMTLEGTPSIVTPTGIAMLEFRDEADTVNALVPHLRRRGIETFVVLLHEGGSVADPIDETTINSCNQPTGPVPDIVDRLHDAVDVVVTGHTNWAVNCEIDGKIVTGAAAGGRLITDIDLRLSRRTGDVVASRVENRITTPTVEPSPAITALIEEYRTLSDPLANRPVGETSAAITREPNAAGESALGDVIADSQLAATSAPELGGAVIALMNPGGIRAELDAGPVTYAEIFAVQPFGNSLVTMTLTGAQLDAALEQQWQADGTTNVLQVSRGFTYAYDPTAPIGERVDPSTIALDGTPVDPAASYRVTVNSFLAGGGDGFTVLTEGTDQLGGAVDLDALEAYFAEHSPVPPGPQDRITTTAG